MIKNTRLPKVILKTAADSHEMCGWAVCIAGDDLCPLIVARESGGGDIVVYELTHHQQ